MPNRVWRALQQAETTGLIDADLRVSLRSLRRGDVLPGSCSDPGPDRCEHCGHIEVERMVSAFNVRRTAACRPSERCATAVATSSNGRSASAQAMQALETRTGMKLPAERVDAAMHRLSQANKSS